MKDFDWKIKDIAGTEQVNVPKGFERRIDDLIDNIDEELLVRGRRKAARPSFIFAVIGTCILLIGSAVYAAGIISSYTIGWNGNIVRTNYEEAPFEDTLTEDFVTEDYVKESEDEYEFRKNSLNDEIRRIGSIDENGMFSESVGVAFKHVNIASLRDLEEQLKEAQDNYLKLPLYIPEGYELDRIGVSYYLSPDYIDPYKPPEEIYISENGNAMQVFKLPKEYKKYICGYHLGFRGSNERYLDISGSYNEANKRLFDITTKESINNPKIEGFEKTLYYTNFHEEEDWSQFYSSMTVLHSIKPIEYYTSSHLDYNNSSNKRRKNLSADRYKGLEYNVTATNDYNIDEGETIKIIESLYLPK